MLSIRWGLISAIVWSLTGIWGVLLFHNAYKKTRSLINKLFMHALVALTLSYFTLIILFVVPKEKASETFAFYIFAIVNTCIIIALVLGAEGLVYNYYGSFPYYSQFIVFIAGIVVTTILDPMKTEMIYDSRFDVWFPNYSFKPKIAFLLLAVGYLFYHIAFVYRKFKLYCTHKVRPDGTILGFVLFTAWLISSATPVLKPIRIHLSGIVMLAISLPVYLNPLAYNVTKEAPRAILVYDKEFVPFFLLNVKYRKVKIKTDDLLMVDATAEILTKALNLPARPSELGSKDFEMKRIEIDDIWVAIIGKKVLPQHIAALHSIKKELKNIIGNKLSTMGVLTPKAEELLKVLILKVLRNVCYEN